LEVLVSPGGENGSVGSNVPEEVGGDTVTLLAGGSARNGKVLIEVVSAFSAVEYGIDIVRNDVCIDVVESVAIDVLTMIEVTVEAIGDKGGCSATAGGPAIGGNAATGGRDGGDGGGEEGVDDVSVGGVIVGEAGCGGGRDGSADVSVEEATEGRAGSGGGGREGASPITGGPTMAGGAAGDPALPWPFPLPLPFAP
jgi:hypothetical protein